MSAKIECGRCGASRPIEEFTSHFLFGALPEDVIQCPVCGLCLRRVAVGKWVREKSGYERSAEFQMESEQAFLVLPKISRRVPRPVGVSNNRGKKVNPHYET